jgi:hypothetical protein
MESCVFCQSNLLVVKTSAAGREAYCSKCRRIVESSLLGYKLAEKFEPEECKTPDGRPGYKGPGKKAKCWAYDPGTESEAKAKEKATASYYADKHAKESSKIIHAMGYFTGAESITSGGGHERPLLSGDSPSNPMAPGPQSNPVPPTSHPGKSPEQSGALRPGGSGANGEVPAAPGGIQPGELNGANPANSGTTASKISPRLAELISEEIMGTPFCTKHNCKSNECKSEHELH